MCRAFISYPDEDREFADHTKNFLNLMDIECIVAEKVKQPGEDLFIKILKLINRSTCVVVLYTINAPHSKWVKREIEIANELRKDIVPVVEAGVDVPDPLEALEYIPFNRSDPIKTIENICTDIKRRQAQEKEGMASLRSALKIE